MSDTPTPLPGHRRQDQGDHLAAHYAAAGETLVYGGPVTIDEMERAHRRRHLTPDPGNTPDHSHDFGAWGEGIR